MRSLLKLILAFSSVPLLMGMGGLGGVPEGTVPKTDENIKVRISDRSGVTTDLNEFSMDGNVFLEGRRGDGKMNVFFRDLQEVAFGQVSGDEVPAELLLKSGSRIQLEVRKRVVFYGSTGYGAYRITARDVSRIVIVE
jgi:hypothetical protein